MISEVEADKINQWLRKFQKDRGDKTIVNDDFINDLACALYDNIPLGYEASHRLANWLFCYLNSPKISKNLLMQIQSKMHQQQYAKQRLIEAFSDYERYSSDITTFIIGIDE